MGVFDQSNSLASERTSPGPENSEAASERASSKAFIRSLIVTFHSKYRPVSKLYSGIRGRQKVTKQSGNPRGDDE